MNYDEASNYFNCEIDYSNSCILLKMIADDKIVEGINFIMELTNCNQTDAKLIWVDLKMEYSTSETNPYVEDEIIVQPYSSPNIPKCPICGSTNLAKISTTKKAAKIVSFGIFGAGDIGKTWKCNHCGSKF